MNYLLAKKKRTDNTFFHILSQENNIYELPDLDSPQNYEVDCILEDEEWFGIPNFTETEFSTIELLEQEFNSAEHHQITREDYINVKYFCAYQDENDFCFQRFTYSNIIERKWYSIGDPVIKENEPIIIIKNIPDVIYRKSTNTLYFRNLVHAKNIFPKLEILYKEATDEETEAFLNSEFIALSNDFNKDKVKSLNRRRIAMAMDTLSRLNDDDKNYIHNYIREYCPNLEFSEENNQFNIGNEEHLKQVLFGIEQRYYTTEIGRERRLANSIMRL